MVNRQITENDIWAKRWIATFKYAESNFLEEKLFMLIYKHFSSYLAWLSTIGSSESVSCF